jgi:hypothetical protein
MSELGRNNHVGILGERSIRRFSQFDIMKSIIVILLGIGSAGFLSGCATAGQRKPTSLNPGTPTSVGQPAYSALHSEIMHSY